MTEYMESHQRCAYIHATMINAPILTRLQIRPKLNGKLLDSRDNVKRSHNNIKLFRNVVIFIQNFTK